MAVLAGLLITLPIDALLVGAALLRRTPAPEAARPKTPRRIVLITGGKMTKALQLARAFHTAGHRVILAESSTFFSSLM